MRRHGLWPTRLLCLWDFPGKDTRVGSISFSRGSSGPRDSTFISCIGRQILYHWTSWEALESLKHLFNLCIYSFYLDGVEFLGTYRILSLSFFLTTYSKNSFLKAWAGWLWPECILNFFLHPSICSLIPFVINKRRKTLLRFLKPLYVCMFVFWGKEKNSFKFLRVPLFSPIDCYLPLDCRESVVTAFLCPEHLFRACITLAQCCQVDQDIPADNKEWCRVFPLWTLFQELDHLASGML